MSVLGTLAAGAVLLAFFVLANLGERHRVARILALVASALLAGLAALTGAVVLLLGSLHALLGVAAPGSTRAAVRIGVPLLLTGGLALLYLWPPVQRAASRGLPLRPGSPVTVAAVVLALVFLGVQVGSQLSVDVLSVVASGPPLTTADLLAQDVPLLLLGFLGVGLFTRRSLAQTLERLGLRPVGARWWWIALGGILAFLLVGAGIEKLASVLTPGTQEQVARATQALFRHFHDPVAAAFLGGVAGIAEEVVFRGALQPRFGLVPTAILFAAVHTEYAFTFATLEVFILGLGLGWLRAASKSTLPGIVTHAGYDILVGLLSP